MVALLDGAFYEKTSKMNIVGLRRGSGRSWAIRRKQKDWRSLLVFSVVVLFALFIVFFQTHTRTPSFVRSLSFGVQYAEFPQCLSKAVAKTLGQKFLWYAPHSGFSNQLAEFKNAILMAGILNRTLIVPPILDHHAVVLGSCPKFRVSNPNEIRISVWDHAIQLLRSGRYVSIADVIDISYLVSSSAVRVVDLRVFISLWCGINVELLCSNEVNEQVDIIESLKQCGSLISGLNGNVDKCLYAVDDDCRTTVWTYRSGNNVDTLDSFQADEQLRKRKKISYVRRRRDVYKTLGHGSSAGLATVLSFGSLFSAPYKGSESHIDIHNSERDTNIQSLIERIAFLPFVPEITHAGKKFALDIIRKPFLCAQLRLLDGQFKNHWKGTFMGLKQKLELLKSQTQEPIAIFLMTDLPEANWTRTYLGELAGNSDNFKLYFVQAKDGIVSQISNELASAVHGLKFGSIPLSSEAIKMMKDKCSPRTISDALLFVEETICSCASLGFVGTVGSTIGESIELMRTHNACSNVGM